MFLAASVLFYFTCANDITSVICFKTAYVINIVIK